MASEGFFARTFGSKLRDLNDRLQDQVWFQQIRSKWDELDAKSRLIIRTGSLVFSVVLLAGGTGVLYKEVQSKKTLIEERGELVTKLQKSQDELRKLREASPLNASSDEPWNAFIESKLGAIGIAPEAMTLEPEKSIDHSKEKNADLSRPKETQIDGALKKVNIRQVVKLVYAMENSGRPAKVKRLTIDTEPDESGYLNLSFTLLGYSFQKK